MWARACRRRERRRAGLKDGAKGASINEPKLLACKSSAVRYRWSRPQAISWKLRRCHEGAERTRACPAGANITNWSGANTHETPSDERLSRGLGNPLLASSARADVTCQSDSREAMGLLVSDKCRRSCEQRCYCKRCRRLDCSGIVVECARTSRRCAGTRGRRCAGTRDWRCIGDNMQS